MAEYKKGEFARLCGVEPSAISNAIKRKKINENAAHKIDSTDPVNAYFLQSKLIEQKSKLTTVAEEDSGEDAQEMDASVEFNSMLKGGGDLVKDVIGLEREKKQLDIKKIKEEIGILAVKNEKLRGEVVPTDAVKMILVQHTKSIVSEFIAATDNVIMKIAKLKGLNIEEQAELRGFLVDQVNNASSEAITTTKKSLKNIVNEYATKKGVGEKT